MHKRSKEYIMQRAWWLVDKTITNLDKVYIGRL